MRSPENVPGATHTGLRRRLRHLPLLGRLLAGTDWRACHLPPVPGSGGGFPGYSARGVSTRHSANRARRQGLFRRGRNLSRAAPCTGAQCLVVVVCARSGLRGGKRAVLCIHRSPSWPAQPPQQTPLGTRAGAGALRAGELGVPAAARRDLCRSVCVAGHADPGTGGPRGNSSSGRPPWRGAARTRRHGLPDPAYAVLARFKRCIAARGLRGRRFPRIARGPEPVDAGCAHRPVRALSLLLLRRTGLHGIPVGPASARSGVSGDISQQRIAHRDLALSLVCLPIPVSGGRRQAAFRRSHVARLHRTGVSLLDATAADPSRMVCRGAAGLAPHRRDGRDAARRARDRFSYLPAAASARRRRMLHRALPGAHRAHRQLQLFQSAQHSDVRLTFG